MGATSEHFSAAELRCKRCWADDQVENNGALPELVTVLELFRAKVQERCPGAVLIVNSGYRCDKHNPLTSAGGKGPHVEGKAADVWAKLPGKPGPCLTAWEMYQLALEIPAIRGIGRDDFKCYVHLDTGASGRKFPQALNKWAYNEAGKDVRWFDPPAPGSTVAV